MIPVNISLPKGVTPLKNLEHKPYGLPEEHDSCAIIASVQKDGQPTHSNIIKTIDGLNAMGHRSGDVNGEGDGTGIMTDIPRKLWSTYLVKNNKDEQKAFDPRFFVGHFFIHRSERQNSAVIRQRITALFEKKGMEILYDKVGRVDSSALGPMAAEAEPEFWQLGGFTPKTPLKDLEKELFFLKIEIEKSFPVHVASLSHHSAVYKVRGTAQVLYNYYPELHEADFLSAITIGHGRYSTNTLSIFERVQPFSLLGHNGEINTIDKLRREARMLGISLVVDGSDSQDLDRTVEGLIHHFDLSLSEALEVVFPPIIHEREQMSDSFKDMYTFYRAFWGPFSQGPAGIISRHGDECVFSVDALGLRPVWLVETTDALYFSSEKGVIPVEEYINDPKPFSPGEKTAVLVDRAGKSIRVLLYSDLQARVLELFEARSKGQKIHTSTESNGTLDYKKLIKADKGEKRDRKQLLGALGWYHEDLEQLEQLYKTGNEVVGSLGYDGPLAALSRERVNLSDYFKESVAVVTNPAIDREREMEHFSANAIIGPRPTSLKDFSTSKIDVRLKSPLVLGGHLEEILDQTSYRDLAKKTGTILLEDLLAPFAQKSLVHILDTCYPAGGSLKEALENLQKKAVTLVEKGAQILVLDDAKAFSGDLLWIDPTLMVAAIDKALREATVPEGSTNLRRRAGLVLRSGAIRNLHDLMFAYGLGADAVNPYLMLEIAAEAETKEDRFRNLENLLTGLKKGVEKVTSTMGIHELRGYGRLFSSIGLSQDIARIFETRNFYGSIQVGTTWEKLDANIRERQKDLADGFAKPARQYHFWPKIWKLIGDVAAKKEPFSKLEEKVASLEKEYPISIRHLLEIKQSPKPVDSTEVNIRIRDHNLPFLISAMSFGSQGESAFRAYAEAAYRLNMISLNGEGGEIRDMMGKYPKNRCQQVASGRFGVSAELINSTDYVEIKIGQGAKPGEGGHLPGKKVSAKVAAARSATIGVDLISPSNNHDLYSIEDLAQLIEELKTINPRAKVCVKIPVTPGVATIGLGIAKAGADVITLSGFDGGTGAARAHALKHVGLPTEIGVVELHKALLQAGLRHKVELWADGGLKRAADVVKMVLLGANRVGFGTTAMVSIGCTICRECQMDTCHMGIATQMETEEDAKKKGLKRFVPRVYDVCVDNLVELFTQLGNEVKTIVASMGHYNLQELVGRADLLAQVQGMDRMDLSEITICQPPELRVVVPEEKVRKLRKPLNYMTTLISGLVTEQIKAQESMIVFEESLIKSSDRAVGTHLAGALTRDFPQGAYKSFHKARIQLDESVPGNGFAAFNVERLSLRVEGGAQDGVAKGAIGGKVVVLKGLNYLGERIDGSVGKSFAYGAMKGLFIVQGNADARAGIRLSGADVVMGGGIERPIDDSKGYIGVNSNIKGFAFEYMTNGRALVLGDPGPWICSGMTGGVVYLRLNPAMNFDEAAIRRRIAKGAKVVLVKVNEADKKNIEELLLAYQKELFDSHQQEEALRIGKILYGNLLQDFVKIISEKAQDLPAVSTE